MSDPFNPDDKPECLTCSTPCNIRNTGGFPIGRMALALGRISYGRIVGGDNPWEIVNREWGTATAIGSGIKRGGKGGIPLRVF